jgi:hypothetical protein
MTISASPSHLTQRSATTGGTVQWLAVNISYTLLIGAALFVSAGNWKWAQAWLYLALLLVTQVISAVIMLIKSPDLMTERSRIQPSS